MSTVSLTDTASVRITGLHPFSIPEWREAYWGAALRTVPDGTTVKIVVETGVTISGTITHAGAIPTPDSWPNTATKGGNSVTITDSSSVAWVIPLANIIAAGS